MAEDAAEKTVPQNSYSYAGRAVYRGRAKLVALCAGWGQQLTLRNRSTMYRPKEFPPEVQDDAEMCHLQVL